MDRLHSPVFYKWKSYVEEFNKANPTKKDSWFIILRTNYEDNGVLRIIETARKDPTTEMIADTVEMKLTKEWLVRRNYSPEIPFRELKLTIKKFLSSPNFDLWVKYLDDFNDMYPKKTATMVDSILKNYRELFLMDIIDAAKKAPKTEKVALKLQNELLDKWIKEKLTLASLKRWVEQEVYGDEWIELYTKKLNSLTGKT